MAENKKIYYKDITLKIELSSDNDLKLNELVQKVIEGLNINTGEIVKLHNMEDQYKDCVIVDSYFVNTFPRR